MDKDNFIRTCIVCRRRSDKKNLLRFVKADNIVTIDEKQIADGRGCYVCNEKKCIDELIKKRQLNKAFKMQIDEKNYQQFKKYNNDKFGE